MNKKNSFEITKKVKFHMGHRIPNHKSKCRHLHGHTYFCLVTMQGELENSRSSSDEGMVLDFGDLKSLVSDFINEKLDHGFMVYKGDTEVVDFLKKMKSKNTVVPFIPTAENIAKFLFDTFHRIFAENLDNYPLKCVIKSVKVFETPNSDAEYFNPNL